MQLALHRDEDGERFLLESKLLLCAHTDETDAGHTSLCILDENHNTRSEYTSICLSGYDGYVRSWPVRKRRCSLTCAKPPRSFTRRFGRIPRLRNQVGHTRVPRKLCSTNCASVLASCSPQVRCNSRSGSMATLNMRGQTGEISTILSSSRISPDVRIRHELGTALYSVEEGFPGLENRPGTSGQHDSPAANSRASTSSWKDAKI